MSSVQIGQILEPKAPLARELVLSQNVPRDSLYHPFTRSHNLHATRCESCIDRLYTLGPAPCPVCGKTLKKMTFIPQTFEDLVVEKEVSIRRKLAKESVAGFFWSISCDMLTFVRDQVQQA
jgi:rRNA maturation protein Nop10